MRVELPEQGEVRLLVGAEVAEVAVTVEMVVVVAVVATAAIFRTVRVTIVVNLDIGGTSVLKNLGTIMNRIPVMFLLFLPAGLPLRHFSLLIRQWRISLISLLLLRMTFLTEL